MNGYLLMRLASSANSFVLLATRFSTTSELSVASRMDAAG